MKDRGKGEENRVWQSSRSRAASTIGVFQDTGTMSATQLNSLSTRNPRKATPQIKCYFGGVLFVPNAKSVIQCAIRHSEAVCVLV